MTFKTKKPWNLSINSKLINVAIIQVLLKNLFWAGKTIHLMAQILSWKLWIPTTKQPLVFLASPSTIHRKMAFRKSQPNSLIRSNVKANPNNVQGQSQWFLGGLTRSAVQKTSPSLMRINQRKIKRTKLKSMCVPNTLFRIKISSRCSVSSWCHKRESGLKGSIWTSCMPLSTICYRHHRVMIECRYSNYSTRHPRYRSMRCWVKSKIKRRSWTTKNH